MEKARDITFDIAKGVGILLVVIGHYIPANAPLWYERMVDFFYLFHMPLFFLIAGYFYNLSTQSIPYGRFVRGKFERLMYPYFILSWIVVGIKIAVDGVLQVDHAVSWEALYRVIYLPEAGFYLWFVYSLFLTFCIVPWFRSGKRLALLWFVSILLVFWEMPPKAFCIWQFCKYFVFFVTGMVIARKELFQRLMGRYTLGWSVLSVALGVVYPGVDSPMVSGCIRVIAGVTGSFMIIGISHWLSRRDTFVSAQFNRLGLMSMTIYLFHTLFMGGGKAILTYILSGENIIEFIFSTLFIVGVGIVCPILLYKWVWAKNSFTSRIFK